MKFVLSGQSATRQLGWMALLAAIIICVLLGGAFLPDHTLFSNDGPLGRIMSECHRLPSAFSGVWEDLNGAGYREQGALPNITYGLRLLTGPIWFSKIYLAVALLILALSAWCFFRQSGFAAPACVLGGLAAMLNTDFFSTGCWGIAGHPLAVAMTFLAFAALLKTHAWRGWVRVALAGMAVGMGVAEGADVGIILSLVTATFIVYQTFVQTGNLAKNMALGAGHLAVVVVFAMWIAAQAISVQVNTQIENVRGMQQDVKTREEHWNWATQWSLPKAESASLIIPGVFGNRVDTKHFGNYWGRIGRDYRWDDYLANGKQGNRPPGMLHYVGSGIYVGITVLLVAIWAWLQSLRRGASIFTLGERRWLWFWLGLAVISLLLAYGKFAPFYRLIYELPYFSTFRNPIKFLAVLNIALIISFGYGVEGLWRAYLKPANAGKPNSTDQKFEKLWLIGCGVALVAAVLGWAMYANSRVQVIELLENTYFSPERARGIADYSIASVGWFILFLALATALFWLIIKRTFSGTAAHWGVIALGILLLVDLGRADLPWIVTWNYQEKYASNPIIDFLREKPYESRVALEPYTGKPINDLFKVEWAQQQFQYYNVEALDIVQMPRMPEDMASYIAALAFDATLATADKLTRRWELCNVRYVVASFANVDDLNTKFDKGKERFRVINRFALYNRTVEDDMNPYERMTAAFNPAGDCALVEFTGGLPRAKLYSNWVVNTNSAAVLARLQEPAFDPWKQVLVGSPVPGGETVHTNVSTNGGAVEFTSYAPKDVSLTATAPVPSILLLNDRFEPNWRASVDGKPAPILHCNYLMRGLYLEPGTHKIEFHFRTPMRGLYISLTGLIAGLVLIGLLAMPLGVAKGESTPPVEPSPIQEPVAKSAIKPEQPVNAAKPGSKKRR